MNITAMNVKITFQKNDVVIDKIGNHTNKWVDYYSCYATVSGETGSEQAVVGETVENMLDEVKQSIINAYELKTGLSRAKISHLMDCETWLSAKKAVELHFADGILFGKNEAEIDDESYAFSQREVSNNLINKLKTKSGVKISYLETRLNLLK